MVTIGVYLLAEVTKCHSMYNSLWLTSNCQYLRLTKQLTIAVTSVRSNILQVTRVM